MEKEKEKEQEAGTLDVYIPGGQAVPGMTLLSGQGRDSAARLRSMDERRSTPDDRFPVRQLHRHRFCDMTSHVKRKETALVAPTPV